MSVLFAFGVVLAVPAGCALLEGAALCLLLALTREHPESESQTEDWA